MINRGKRKVSSQDKFRLRIASVALAAVLLFGLVLVPQAKADTTDNHFAVEDAGRTMCSRYVEARGSNPALGARYLGFIEGYLTAANRYEPNTFDLTPWHTPEAFALILDQHCGRAPDETLAMVAQRLVISMMPHRLASKSDLVEVRAGDNRAIVYERIIWRAQNQLTRHGLYQGEADGKDSPQFRAALTRFQELASLDPSGIPDVATLWILLNP